MKKFLLAMLLGTMFVSCTNTELNEVNTKYEEMSLADNEKKKDPNFLIFKDRTQTGKSETK
jgi:hypothetical protein